MLLLKHNECILQKCGLVFSSVAIFGRLRPNWSFLRSFGRKIFYSVALVVLVVFGTIGQFSVVLVVLGLFGNISN